MKDMNLIIRKIYSLLLAFVMVQIFNACADLELQSDGRLQYEDIFSEYTRTRNFRNRCYDYLKDPGFNNGYTSSFFVDNSSITLAENPAMLASYCDEAQDVTDGQDGGIKDWYTGTTSAFSNPLDVWENYFEGIRKCNVFLDCMNDPEIATVKLGDLERSGWIAEVRTLRAYYYLQLIKRYGGVPLMDKPYDTEHDYSQDRRATFEECVDFILADCDAALSAPQPGASETTTAGFRWTVGAAESNIVSRGFAYAVKSQAALYAASPLWSTPESKYTWAKAAEITKEALDECLAHNYELYTTEPPTGTAADAYDYYFNVLEPDAIRAIDKETIYRAKGRMNVWQVASMPFLQDKGAEKAGPCPTQELVDAYEMADGTPFNWNNPAHAANPYSNRDPRFYSTIYYNGASSALGGTVEKIIFPMYFLRAEDNIPTGVEKWWNNVYDETIGDSIFVFAPPRSSSFCIRTSPLDYYGDYWEDESLFKLPVRQKRLYTFEYKLPVALTGDAIRFYWCIYAKGSYGYERPGVFYGAANVVPLEYAVYDGNGNVVFASDETTGLISLPATGDDWYRFEISLNAAINTWGFGMNSDYGDLTEEDGAYPGDHRIRFDVVPALKELSIARMQIECFDPIVPSVNVITAVGGNSAISNVANNLRNTRTGYYLHKFYNFKSNADNPLDGYMRIFRLGELYLNYAEAAANAGNAAEARAAINKIRSRAGMPDLPASLQGEALIERIHNERRVELAFEEHRFFDVRRWQQPTGNLEATDRQVTGIMWEPQINGTDTTYVVNPDRRPVFTRSTSDRKYLMLPIPQSEVAKMREYTGKDWQNPGW
jgi:hypothetical protein